MHLTLEDRVRDMETDLVTLKQALRDRNYRYAIGRVESMMHILMKILGEIARQKV